MRRFNRKIAMREVRSVRLSLRVLDRSLRRLAPVLSAIAALNGTPKENGRHRPRLSARARGSFVLQGRYMGYMRQLKPRQKTQVRKIREANGVRAAIQRARALTRERFKI